MRTAGLFYGPKLLRKIRPLGPHTVQTFATEWRSYIFTVWGAEEPDGLPNSSMEAGWLPELLRDMERSKIDPSYTDGLYHGPASHERNAQTIGMPRGYGYGSTMGSWVLDYLTNWGGELAFVLHCDARYVSPSARRAHEDALDEEVAAWTRTCDAAAIEALLQAHGVAASAVQDSAALCADAQLAHRGHFLRVPHARLGTTTIEATRFRLSRTPAEVPDGAPTFGRDTATVLADLLGYDEARITELVRSGALE